MDVLLMLGNQVQKYLHFNSEEQCVDIQNLPSGHTLEQVCDNNKLDVFKYFKKVRPRIEYAQHMIYIFISSYISCIVPDCRARDLRGDGDQVAGRAGGGAAAALHRLLQPVPRLHEGRVAAAPARPLPL